MSGYADLCKSVFAIDRTVRFAGVIGRMGKLVAGGMREGIKPLESVKDVDKVYVEYALRHAMRSELNAEFGKTLYTFSERERIKIATFPLEGDNLLLISMEKDSPHDKILSRVSALVRG